MPIDAEHSEGLRRGDVAEFAVQFCRTVCESSGYGVIELAWSAIFALEQSDFRDLRELGEAVEGGIARARAERCKRIERRHIVPTNRQWTSFREATERFQEQYLRDVLEREDWNLTAVARALDLTRSHVYNLMGSFGIRRPRVTPPVEA